MVCILDASGVFGVANKDERSSLSTFSDVRARLKSRESRSQHARHRGWMIWVGVATSRWCKSATAEWLERPSESAEE